MPNYYYVGPSGTATGDAGRYTTKQTGSFAALGTANYYATIAAALAATTAPVAGDYIVCSNLYAHDNVGGAIANSFPTGGGITCMSVDDANCDQYSAGAKEETNNIIRSSGTVTFIGFTHDTSVAIEANVNSHVTYIASTLNLTTTSDRVGGAFDGASMELRYTTINCSASSCGLEVSNGAIIRMYGGGFTGTAITDLIPSGSYANGGGVVEVYGADLSNVTGTLNNDGGTQSADDLIIVNIDMCKLAAAVTHSTSFANYNHFFKMTRSSDSSAAAEYQYTYKTIAGELTDNSTTYRSDDEPFTQSNTRISYKAVTTSDCGQSAPFEFDFPVNRYSALSSASTDTLRFYVTTNTALTDVDMYVTVLYPDGTNKQTPNRVSSRAADYFGAGTTLTTDATSTWTSGLTNKYQIDVDTSGDAGADCVPVVKVYITKPSVTIHIASEYGLV